MGDELTRSAPDASPTATGPPADPPTLPHVEPAAAPPAVAGYDILAELGRGGMGVVYRGRQLPLNREVALKMILAGPHAGAAARLRFLTEAEVIAGIRHPHVVAVYEFGTRDGQPFYSMEYLPGGSLADRVRGTPVAPREAAALVAKLARAVHAAHAAGVIHRDLKPGNVLFDAAGEPRVVDFGLARQAKSDLTVTGLVIGTPSYMAPEQADGRPRDVGPETDVYALGAILYACLTGQPPFEADSVPETLEQVRTREPVSPRARVPAVHRDIDTICLKCLQKEPAKRYATAAALADDLERFLRDEPIIARPTGRRERAVRWVRRNPTRAGLLAAVGLLAVLVPLAATLAYTWQHAESQRARAHDLLGRIVVAQTDTSQALDQEREARKEATDARRQFEALARIRQVDVAHREWQAGDLPRAVAYLAAVPPDARGWEWHYVDRLCHAEEFRYDLPDGRLPTKIAAPLRGNVFAVTDGVSVVRVIEYPTGRVRATLKSDAADWSGAVRGVAFDAAGDWLAVASSTHSVAVWDWKAGTKITSFALPDVAADEVAFDPTDRTRLAVAGSNAVAVMDVTRVSDPPVWKARVPPPAANAAYGASAWRQLEFSPDGIRLAALRESGPLYVFDGRTGDRVFDIATDGPTGFGFQQKDGELAVGFAGPGPAAGAVRGYGVRGQGGRLPFTADPMGVAGIAVARTNAVVAVRGSDLVTRVFDPGTAKAAGGRLYASVRGHTKPLMAMTFLTDPSLRGGGASTSDRLLTASADGSVRGWVLSGSLEHRGVATGYGAPASHAWDAAGTVVTSAGMNGLGVTWAAATPLVAGGPAAPIASIGAGLPRAVWRSPDGRALRLVIDEYPGRAGPTPFAGVAGAAAGATAAAPTVRVVELPGGKVASNARLPAGNPAGARFSGDGRYVLLPNAVPARTVHVQTASGPAYQTTSMPGFRVVAADTAAVAADVPGEPHWVYAAAVTPDGRLRLAYGNGDVRTWDLATGRPQADAQLPEPRQLLAGRAGFDPTGDRLAGEAHGSCVVWDLRAGTGRHWPHDHNGAVLALALTPDGTRLASAGADRVLKVWDVATGTPTLTLRPDKSVTRLMFTADGRRLLAWSAADGQTLVYDGSPRPAR